MNENSGLIYHPPSHHRLCRLFTKYVILAIFLLVFIYAYGRWIRELMPDWASLVVVFVVLLAILWLYRVEKAWIFEWGDNRVIVSLKQNLLMFAWLDVRINGAILLSKITRIHGSVIELNETVQYSNKTIPIVLNIRKTKEPHLVECAIQIEGQSLTT